MPKATTVGERLVKIENDIDYIKQAVNKIETFIEQADCRYALKKELEEFKTNVKEQRREGIDWIRGVVPWILTLLSMGITILIATGVIRVG